METLIQTGLNQLVETTHIPEKSPALLARYGELLLQKNQVMNLTAITDPQDVATLHMLDCAALLNCADFRDKTLIDVGTGAGFPGVPLKILVPTLEVTLLDSLNKRVDWLTELCEALDLDSILAIHARAEEEGQSPTFRAQYDYAVALAVADLRLLCELCLPFVKAGGYFLAMKSTESDDELTAALPAVQTLGGRFERSFDYTIPHANVTHRVIMIKKTAPTPQKYPRRWAKIQKSPL